MTTTLISAATATSGRIVVAEDHHPEGGLGAAVAGALLDARASTLSIVDLAVGDMSGSSSGLPPWARIDAERIATAARRAVAQKESR